MEIRIKDGSNHIECMRIAMENKVDFDYYFIYYEEEHNKIRSYGNLLAESPKHAMGMDDSGRFRYIIDSDTNQIVKDLSEFSNSQMP